MEAKISHLLIIYSNHTATNKFLTGIMLSLRNRIYTNVSLPKRPNVQTETHPPSLDKRKHLHKVVHT